MSGTIKEYCSTAVLETGLKVVSLCSTGFFAGGSAFIAYAYEPGVTSISNHCALAAFHAFLPRCRPLPASLLLGTLSSAAVYALSVHKDKADSTWLIGAGVLGAIVPQTIIFIGPVNGRILREEVEDDDAPEEIGKWRFHHLLRTVAACGVFVFYAYKLAKK